MNNARINLCKFMALVLLLSSFLAYLPGTSVNAISKYPQIAFVGIEHSPLVEGDKESFFISSRGYDGQVQYRVWLNKVGEDTWADITNGYTSPVNPNFPVEIRYDKPFALGQYKISVWVKIAGTNGYITSKNGSYDSLYIAHLNCVSKDPINRVYADGNVNLQKEIYTLGDTINVNGIDGIGGIQGPYSYKLHVFSPSKSDASNKGWKKDVTGYSTNGIQWKPEEAGTYIMDIWANVPGSKAPYEAWKLKTIKVEDAVVYEKVDAVIGPDDSTGPEQVDNNVNITGNGITIKNQKISGNIYINADKAILKNVSTAGTIYINPGKDGTANLDNVTANKIEVLSGSKNSIHLNNVSVKILLVNNKNNESPVRVESTGTTTIDTTVVGSYAILDSVSGSFGTVEVKRNDEGKLTVEFRGTFISPIKIDDEATIIAAQGASIRQLEINPEKGQTVTLQGKFSNVTVSGQANINLVNSTIDNIIANSSTTINVDAASQVQSIENNNNTVTVTGEGSGSIGTGSSDDKDPLVNAQTPKIVTNLTNVTITIGTPVTLNAAATVSDGGHLTYLWYRDTNTTAGGGTPISPAVTTATYQPDVSAAGTYYYYCVITNTNNSATGRKTSTKTSAVARVTVQQPSSLVDAETPNITNELANVTTPAGTPVTLNATATVSDGGHITYLWYSDTDSTAGGGTAISPAVTTATYQPDVSVEGAYYYYCVITNTNNSATGRKTSTKTSAVARVTVQQPSSLVDAETPNITNELANVTTPAGTPVTLNATATVSDGGHITYLWYSDTDSTTGGGTAISPAVTTATYQPDVAVEGTYYYYCVITNTNNSATGSKTASKTSAVARVTVQPPSSLVDAETPNITNDLANVTTPAGIPVILDATATVSDGGHITYLWYRDIDSTAGGGTAISPAVTTATYQPDVAVEGTYYYYCVITNTNNSATGNKTASKTSAVARVTVQPPSSLVDAETPNITDDLANVTTPAGTPVTLNATATVSDGGHITYLWYRDTDSTAGGGTAISPAVTAATYQPDISIEGTYYYYCVITNTNNSATGSKTASITSAVAIVTVQPPLSLVDAETPNITNDLANVTTPAGTPVTLNATATVSDGGHITYLWYRDTDSTAGGGTAISPAVTTATYQPDVSVVGTYYYYCVITNTNNSATGNKTTSKTSTIATVTVQPLVDAETPNITNDLANVTTPAGTQVTLNATATVSDGGHITYLWYSDTDSTAGGGTAISPAVATAAYQPDVSVAGTYYYYCVITNTNNSATGGKTASITSSIATVTVTAPVYLYIADYSNNVIIRCNPDGTMANNIIPIVDGTPDSGPMAMTVSGGKVYFAGQDSRKIECADLDGTNRQIIIDDTGTNNISAIAVDEVGQRIYWADYTSNIIVTAKLDGTGTSAFVTNADTAGGGPLALVISMGKLYWACDINTSIQYINLDGTGRSTAFSTGAPSQSINSIVIDDTTGKIYWNEYINNTIRSAGLTGLDKLSVISNADKGIVIKGVTGIALYNGWIYWICDSNGEIRRARLDGSNETSVYLPTDPTAETGIIIK